MHHSDGSLHGVVDGAQMSLDFRELYPLTTDLDLEVLTANQVHLAIISIPDKVTGLAESPGDAVLVSSQRVAGRHGLGLFGIGQVPSSQSRTFNDKLSDGPMERVDRGHSDSQAMTGLRVALPMQLRGMLGIMHPIMMTLHSEAP